MSQQARQYAFSHFTTGHGLASNFVNSISEDADGYIWLATVNGLQRYDGNRFLNIKTGRETGLTVDHTSHLYKDKKNRMWVTLADNKVGIFDTRSFRFREIMQPQMEKAGGYLKRSFFEGHEGILFMLIEGRHLYRYEETTGVFRDADNIIPFPPGWARIRIAWDAGERKYWMSSDSGLLNYDPITTTLCYKGHNPAKNPVIENNGSLRFVSSILSATGYVYASNWPPNSGTPFLYRINKSTGKTETFNLTDQLSTGYHEISGLIEQRSKRLWVLGNPILAEWTTNKKPFIPVPLEFKNEQSIRFDYLYSAFEDDERNLWLATDNGVFLFNPDAQVFDAYNLLRPQGKPVEAAVLSTAQLPDSSIFVGCWGKGLYYFDKKFNPLNIPASLVPFQDRLSIWDMCWHTRTKKLWMVLQPAGVIVYDPATRSSKRYQLPVFNNRTIRQVTEDRNGNLWFGAQDGKLVKWDILEAKADPSKGYEVIYQSALIQKLHMDNEGFIWAGTNGAGLYKVDPNTNKVIAKFTDTGAEGKKLFSNVVSDMTQYDDTTLIATAGAINIINTRTGSIRYFSAKDGLPSNTALSIQKDNNNILWVGMLNGLSRVNLSRKITTYYDRRDGIPYDNFNTAGVEKLFNGNLLFYTDHNFITFDPNRFFQSAVPPKPVITSVSVGGKSLNIDSVKRKGVLELQYSNTSVAFEFSSLAFTKQKKFHYFYQLSDVEEDWVHIDNDNRAIYNYLPPGRYVFRVKSENADGLTSKEVYAFPVIVRPPAWRTWWFYALVILLIALGLYIIDRERLKRLRAMQRVRTQIAGNLHKEVETTLSNINVLSEIAKIRAETNIEQSKDFIDQISRKSRNMMEAMDDVLWSIDPVNDNMQKTILRIKEFTEGLRHTHNVDIDLIVEKKVQSLELDMALRHNLFFFYKEALNFIINHTGCSQVFINMKQKRSFLVIEILSECTQETDDLNLKFEAAVQNRVHSINGILDFASDRNNISIMLQVPV